MINGDFVKRIIIGIVSLLLVIFGSTSIFNKNNEVKTNTLSGMVLSNEDNRLVIMDKNNIIYTFDNFDSSLSNGDRIVIEYTGLLNDDSSIVSYTPKMVELDEFGIPKDWLDGGIFSQYYKFAYEKLQELTLEEKIGQLFLVRYPESNAVDILKQYNFGGYIFFEKDFKNKTKDDVKTMINEVLTASKITPLTAVDEEGGKVIRVSSNPNLSDNKFLASQELYKLGGFNKIKEDTIIKSKLLKELGINLNLAPVVDISLDTSDYIYARSFGQDAKKTAEYAKLVISASKETDVSYALKHFPGYGKAIDSHVTSTFNEESYDTIVNEYLLPFKSGVVAGAEAILVNHNIYNNIDKNNPATLSLKINNLLRKDVKFTGIAITDDMMMDAVNHIDGKIVRALLAGNNLIIVTNYEESINEIKKAIEDKTLSEDFIDKNVFKILAWKYYKDLINYNQK